MPIDFLGKPEQKKAPKASEVKWHVPLKERYKEAKSQEPPKAAPKKIVKEETAEFKEVNFITGFKRYILKRRLMFSVIFVIIIIVVAVSIFAIIYFYPEQKPPLVVTPSPAPSPAVTVTPRPSPSPNPSVTPMIPSPTPIVRPSPTPTPTILPDTELASLRGAVVKFQDEETLYLIENNGELREIDLENVSFVNQGKIQELSPDLIYTIADRYKNIRRGKAVTGRVEWDPRVLSPAELSPFL